MGQWALRAPPYMNGNPALLPPSGFNWALAGPSGGPGNHLLLSEQGLGTGLPGGAQPGPVAIGQLSRLGAVTCQQGLPRELRLIINRIAIRSILTLILILIIMELECT